MKTRIIPALLLATLLLPACGKFQTERKPFDQSQFALLTSGGGPLSPQQFAESCSSKPGVLVSNNTICVFTSQVKTLNNGEGSLIDIPIAEVMAGSAVHTTGSVYGGSMELVLNGNRIGNVPNQSPITLSAGQLAFRLKPGSSYYNVKAYIYSCVNRNQQLVPCPY
jgi:hypothetical protein